MLRKYFAMVLLLSVEPSYAVNVYTHNDWVCFVNPFDLSPENRVNILGSKDTVGILHVERDGKKLKNQRELSLRGVSNVDNQRVFSLSSGDVFSVTIETSYGFNRDQSGRKLEIVDGWYPGIYIKGRLGGGGILYKCKPVQLVPLK